MNRIAIIAVAYNRINSLTRLLKSLEDAHYGSEEPTLIISIDKSKTDIVEKFADEYHWSYGEKIVRKHEQNLGLRNHMMSLGEWFEEFDTLIILEDDLVISPCFYIYTRQASDKYLDNPNIAGLSLYSFAMNYHTGTPFIPVINEYDGYYMNCAMSWGEVWMKPQWLVFYQWYLNHQNFLDVPHLPESLYKWDKSWLKYHTRYCIEENKYFLYPYVSLSTNFGDTGTHNKGSRYTTYQVVLQQGKKTYSFPDSEREAVCYDGFFENKAIYKHLEIGEEDCCVDLYRTKKNRMNRRYWLTTDIMDLPIVKSFGLAYKPMEQNILLDIVGNEIFLYDAKQKFHKAKENKQILLYRYNVGDLTMFLREFGLYRIFMTFVKRIISKI